MNENEELKEVTETEPIVETESPTETEIGFDYLSTVKVLLGITDTEKDLLLGVYIDMTKRSILNFCNLSEFPDDLNYTLCLMVADTYRDLSLVNTKGEVVGNVGSISEDGRSVSFSNGAEFKTAVDDRISRTTELKRFRKLYRIE